MAILSHALLCPTPYISNAIQINQTNDLGQICKYFLDCSSGNYGYGRKILNMKVFNKMHFEQKIEQVDNNHEREVSGDPIKVWFYTQSYNFAHPDL